MLRLLAILRSPQKRLPPVIHVAGTNGKGSTLAYLHAIFEAAGYRVHRYTSPHLVHFRERIILQGKEIDNAGIEKIFRYISPALQQQQVTFFEAITAAAFVAFSEKPADILLLETGLGGLLDATNVIEKPLVTIITPIAFDHMEFLGDTIQKIAGEKAGIIKRGVPCIIGRQEFPEAMKVLEDKATQLSAPLFRLGQEWRIENHRYISPAKNIELTLSLAGEHQYDNAGAAIACIEQMPQFNISDEHIVKGLASAVWPARLQHLTNHPYCALLPANVELWLDGGHNPQGGQVLAKWLEGQAKDKKIYLVCGMIKGKDMKEFLRYLAPYAEFLCSVIIREEANSQTSEAVAEAAQAVGIKAQATSGIEKALQTVIEKAKDQTALI
ncbi:MAG: folylpolyglutamate synthase/dihydrofolate synthase family protein, partial [Rickettsiales bacterium]